MAVGGLYALFDKSSRGFLYYVDTSAGDIDWILDIPKFDEGVLALAFSSNNGANAVFGVGKALADLYFFVVKTKDGDSFQLVMFDEHPTLQVLDLLSTNSSEKDFWLVGDSAYYNLIDPLQTNRHAYRI